MGAASAAIEHPAAEQPSKWMRWAEDTQAFVITHYLPLSFAVALTIALAWPAPGIAALHVTVLNNIHILQEVGMGIVFFISGITLNTKELSKVKGNVWAVVFGFVSILFITPCLGFALRYIPLQPREFTIGLVIFCVVPTTLGVGVALVRSCKGNEAIALLLTVTTNMLGVFTMPAMLKFLFLGMDTADLNFTVDIPSLLVMLVITILAPSLLGKALRDLWPALRAWCDCHKVHLSITSTTCLALIIWMTLSGARNLLFQATGGMIAAVIVLGASIHAFYLLANYLVVCHLLNAATAEAVAVVITSAQKSAPVAVTLISYATTNVSQQGLLAIPSIVGQLSQIFIGAAFVPAVLARTKAAAAREEAERERREKEAGVQDQAQGGGNGDDGDEEAGPFDRGATATAAAAEATTGPVVNVSPARSGGAPTALVCINNLDNERPLAHSGLSSGLSAEGTIPAGTGTKSVAASQHSPAGGTGRMLPGTTL